MFRKGLLIAVLIFLSFSVVCDAKFDVHILYFKPADAADIDREYHDTILKDIQRYFQSEMTRHGFTDKTHPLEFDEDGKIVIHTIDAPNNSRHYRATWEADGANWFDNQIDPALPFRFRNSQNWDSRDNVHLIIIGGVEDKGWNAPAFGFTWHGGRWGGNAIVTLDTKRVSPNHYIAVVAHELGHAFALDPGHNGVQQAFNGLEIAWGRTTAEWGDRMRILDFEAALLDSRPVFREIVLQDEPEPQNKNEDLDQGGDEEVEKDKGQPISVVPASKISKITLTWGKLKVRK